MAGIIYKAAPLVRDLQGRHIQMTAIGKVIAVRIREYALIVSQGGVIGAGLFFGSGSALHVGGPASLECDLLLASRVSPLV